MLTEEDKIRNLHMRGLSAYDRSIVNKLYAIQEQSRNPLLFWKIQTQPDEVNPKLFSQLSGAGAIGALAPFSLHPKIEIARAALRQIESLMSTHAHANLGWIDECIRAISYFCRSHDWAQSWYNANDQIISNIPYTGRDLTTVLMLLACHNNGFTRLEAIKALVNQDVEAALRLAFIRANDWVAPVSKTALEIIERHLPKLQESQLIQYLHLVDQLGKKQRRDLESVQVAVRRQLSSDAGCDALTAAVKGADYRTARLAFSVLAENTNQTDTLLELSSTSPDIVIRSKSFAFIEKLDSTEDQLRFLKILSRDLYCPIVKRSLYTIAERFPEDAEESLVKNLLHTNKGVRELCRFYLKSKGYVDFFSHYIDRLNEDKPSLLTAAILGLSETGSANHWNIVENLTDSCHPRVQGAIVRAANTLGKLPDEWFERKVISGSLTEAREASEILARRDAYHASKVNMLLGKCWDEDHLTYILNISRRKDKWGYLNTLLSAFIIVRSSNRELDRRLDYWIKRYYQPYWYVKPNQALLDELLNLTTLCRSIRDTNALKAIDAFVKSVNSSSV